MQRVIKFFQPGIFPFSICILLLIFILIYRLFSLPSPQELVVIIVDWFNEYGFKLLFIAAFLEGIFIFGMYFPGSLVIALSIYTFGNSGTNLVIIGSISFFAFLIANICNFFLGKYGYYKLLLLLGKKDVIIKMQQTMLKRGNWTFFLTGFFPNFIAITSVCAGISRLSFGKLLLLQSTALLFWVTIWTIIGAIVITEIDLQDNNQSVYLLLVIFLWGIFLSIKENYKKKSLRKIP